MRNNPSYQFILILLIADSDYEIWSGNNLNDAINEFFRHQNCKPFSTYKVKENGIFYLALEKIYKRKHETIYELIMECSYDTKTHKLNYSNFSFNQKSINKIKKIAKKEHIQVLIDVLSKPDNYRLLL